MIGVMAGRVLGNWKLIAGGLLAAAALGAWLWIGHVTGQRHQARDKARTLAGEVAALGKALDFERQARAAIERLAADAAARQVQFDDIRRSLDATAPALDAPIPAELDAVLGRLRDARAGGAVPQAGDSGRPADAPAGP